MPTTPLHYCQWRRVLGTSTAQLRLDWYKKNPHVGHTTSMVSSCQAWSFLFWLFKASLWIQILLKLYVNTLINWGKLVLVKNGRFFHWFGDICKVFHSWRQQFNYHYLEARKYLEKWNKSKCASRAHLTAFTWPVHINQSLLLPGSPQNDNPTTAQNSPSCCWPVSQQICSRLMKFMDFNSA